MTKDEFGLGLKELSILFPFHFIFDANLIVLQVGPSSSEIFGITKDSSLSNHIKIKLPDITLSFSKISQLTNKNFLLKSTRNSLILHGQMLLLENQEAIAFLGSPWITESEQFYKSGLKMTHFAIHYPVMDYIFLLQAQKMSINDTRVMARKNLSINQKLEQANKELKNRTKELTRLNRELQKAKEKLKLILDAAGEGIYGLDTEGNTTFINPAGAKIFGYEIHDLIGKNHHAMIHHSKPDGSPYPAEECHINNAIQTGMVNHVSDEVFWRRDGSSFPVEYVSTPIWEGKKTVGAVVVFRDISERKKAEKKLQKSQRNLVHSEKLAATGKLSASIAHEFNNPLYGIKNVLEEVYEGVEMDSAYKELVEIGIKECKRIAGLIRKLQDFHSPSSGIIQPMDVNEAIDDVILLIKKNLKAGGIELKLNYGDSLPRVEAVADQIKQVVLNIIQNAEQALQEGGGLIVVTTEQVDASVKIHVSDSGCGISPENLKHIFDPFYTTKSAVKGTGLGLSISHGIIKAHGGEIEVESEPGKGTTMTITLPVMKKGIENER